MSTLRELNPKLTELAELISANAKILEEYLAAEKLPYPSFAADGPASFPLENKPGLEKINAARDALLSASKTILDLTMGATESIHMKLWNYEEIMTIRTIHHFKIAQAVPTDGKATFAEIAAKVGLGEVKVRQILRSAITSRIFYEPEHGYVAHTTMSRALVDDAKLQNWVDFNTNELAATSGSLVEALQKWPASEEPTETAFQIKNETDLNLYHFLGTNPPRAKRFGQAMAGFVGGFGHHHQHFVDGYGWDKLAPGAKVVDLGGGNGFVSIALAEKYPDIKYIVQDFESQLTHGRATLPAELATTISFQEHDFFKEQPVKDADIYFFRWIFHNWSDKYAVQILKALVPSLKNGAKVLINDGCLPDPGTASLWDEKRMRTMDILMMLMFNALEREVADWKALFEKADPRYRFDGVILPPGSLMFIIEATFVDDKAK